ncbi:MAG: glycosyltransferase family 2 protein [Candidatus Falkowbacteria bacterium]|nr:MAG: glycosyltransferase family 2 protein [Candidatus Falkowbacteria bacterium]
MDKPLLSICIPTFNRAPFLKECLKSLADQFSSPLIKNRVDIFILDNQSADNTSEIVKPFIEAYDNIKYIVDSEPRKIIPGIIKAASLADGEYVWVFSDDDLQSSDSLTTLIDFINKNHSDLILGNIMGFSDKSDTKYNNLLKVSEDVVMNNKKEFFALLNTKFNTSIDYYTTLCSNWIIKKEIYDKNSYIFEKFNDKSDMFPFPSLFFYTDMEFSAGVIAKEIVLNRGDNETWGSKNKIKHFFYRHELWKNFYQKIIDNNTESLPNDFIKKVKVKNLARIKDLLKIIAIIILRKIKLYDQLKKIIKK